MTTENIAATTVVCPTCNAQVLEPCTQPTDTGRRPVRWFHYTRLDALRQAAS